MGFSGGGLSKPWMDKLTGQPIPPTDGAGGPVSSMVETKTVTTPKAPTAPKGPFEQKEKLGP